MLYLTITMMSSVDLAYYGVSCTKDSVSVDCGIIECTCNELYHFGDFFELKRMQSDSISGGETYGFLREYHHENGAKGGSLLQRVIKKTTVFPFGHFLGVSLAI